MVEAELRMQVNLFVSDRKLKDLDVFSKSDPQCILYEQKNNQWIEVGRTEVIMNNLDPDFNTVIKADYYFETIQNFKFCIIDVDDGVNNFDTIGEIEVTMGKLMGAPKQVYTSKLVHNGKDNRGIITVRTQATGEFAAAFQQEPVAVQNIEPERQPTLVEYLRSGWQVGLVVAIDYTASNGDPNSPHSLHYLGPENQYEAALFNVGMVVEPYDHDKMFPVFGFGGIPRHMGSTTLSHCFPMNGNSACPDIRGIENIAATYRQTLPNISLFGPTSFAPLLQEFLNLCRSQVGRNSYQILQIMTDGMIFDMDKTKDLIFELAELPCSIIIIGMGSEDFSAMVELDGDNGPLTNSSGQPVARDIVQFVVYNQSIAQGNLAEQVLKEVPGQICSYMQHSGFKPVPLPQ